MAYRIQSDQSKALTSFADKMAWIKEAQARYDAYDAALQDAQDKAADLETLQYSNNAKDRAYYQQVQAYNQQAKDMANTLSSTGQIDRNALSALRSTYREQINPINKAFTKQQDIMEKRNTAAINNPTLIFSQAPTLEQLMANPNASYNTANVALVQAQATELMKSKSTREKINTDFSKVLGNQYWKSDTTTGYSNAQLEAMLQSGTLGEMAQKVLDANGINDKNGYTDKDIDTATQAALNGLLNGAVYDHTVNTIQNKDLERTIQGYQISDLSNSKQGFMDEVTGSTKIFDKDGNIIGVQVGNWFYDKTGTKKGADGKEHNVYGNARYGLPTKGSSKSSKGSTSSGGAKRVAAFERPLVIDSGGNRKNPEYSNSEDFKLRGQPVTLTVSDDSGSKTVIDVKTASGVTVGKYTIDGDAITFAPEYASNSEAIKKEWNIDGLDETDLGILKNAGAEIKTIVNSEGAAGLSNYGFYYDSDDMAWNQGDDGAFTIMPLNRAMPTSTPTPEGNEDNNDDI